MLMNHSFRPVLEFIALGLLIALVGVSTGCSSGSAGPTAGLGASSCASGRFCVTSCSLGCGSNTSSCSRTELAINEAVRVTFSSPVDPRTLTPTTFSIQSPSGRAPIGSLTLEDGGLSVVFTPEVRVVGGVTVFGFEQGEDYTLSVPGTEDGSGPTLATSSGAPLGSSLRCTFSASQGVADLDEAAPRIVSMQPADGAVGVSADASISVEFSEVIDVAPFQGTGSLASPIIFRVRGGIVRNGVVSECDVAASTVTIPGVPTATTANGRTTVTLRPTVPLPGRSCVEVVLTSDVRDLSGRAAEREVRRFFVEDSVGGAQTIDELFVNALQLDEERSNSTWGNGVATFNGVGGSGVHGAFSLELATLVGPGRFRLDTDQVTVVPGRLSLFGDEDVPVVDGRFEFSDFELPAGVVLELVGSTPAVISVRGRCNIEGDLLANGLDLPPDFVPSHFQIDNFAVTPGEDRGVPGAGGGRGGRGGDSAVGSAPCLPENSGSDGESLRIPGSSGYFGLAGSASTGGVGSAPFPATCNWNDVTFNTLNGWSDMMAAGGSGGAFFDAGTAGVATSVPSNLPSGLGPTTPAPQPIAFQSAGSRASIDHFLVGGSGGGGGPTHTSNLASGLARSTWMAGGSGTGGGGALALRVGGDLLLSGRLEARGGDGATVTTFDSSRFQAPGGGGSGGSVLMQVAGTFDSTGAIDVRGGRGTTVDFFWVVAFGRGEGGSGSGGFVRLEQSPAPSVADLGLVDGVASTVPTNELVGELREVDFAGQAGFVSRFYSTQKIRPPEYLGYELEVVVRDRADPSRVLDQRTYTDDSPPMAGDPIEFRIQGAEVDAQTFAADPATLTPWVRRVASDGVNPSLDDIDNDGAGQSTGFRFAVQALDLTNIVEIERFSVSIQG